MRKAGLSISLLVAAVVLFGSGFWWGRWIGQKTPQTLLVQGVTNVEAPGGVTSTVDFSPFWQAWQYVNQEYLRSGEVSDQEKVYGTIRGLLGSLNDPYSIYFKPSESKKFQEDIQGSFGGIGIEIGVRKGQLVVIAPLKNTPASRAGLRAGDIILQINASTTDNLSIEEAVDRIRGPEKTEVKLSIYRTDWDKPKDFTVTRERIEVPTLDLTMKDGGIAYVQLYRFNATAPQLFADAARTMIRNGSKGIILDLRNDPGGYLEVATDLAGFFLPRNTLVVSQAARTGPPTELRTRGNGVLENLPVVVLLNKGSASASEILAGALRDQRNIQLVGEQSYGKGSVQQIEDLKDGSSVKITVAHWLTPKGKIIDGEGLKPDIEVKISDEDFEKKRDPQLDKALEVLRQQMGK
ncbi:MAG: S41 family peptidase [Candidatus Liptonbacteria bacterium]|nr:S41 family peptidase [Candidatus Liptonbacteria bacterium]